MTLSVLLLNHMVAKSDYDYDIVCLRCRQSMHQQSLTMTLFVCVADKACVSKVYDIVCLCCRQSMQQQSLTMTLFVSVADKACISKILLGHYCLVVLALITRVVAK